MVKRQKIDTALDTALAPKPKAPPAVAEEAVKQGRAPIRQGLKPIQIYVTPEEHDMLSILKVTSKNKSLQVMIKKWINAGLELEQKDPLNLDF